MNTKIAILCIGDELLKGMVRNTHGAYIGRAFFNHGLMVHTLLVSPDQRDQIIRAIDQLSQSHDYLIITGGLGPTTDDLTRDAVCDYLGVTMQEDAQTVAKLRANWNLKFPHFEYPLCNNCQALIIEGAHKIENHVGAALGQWLEIGACKVFLLPGPPREMEPMFDQEVLPFVLRHLNSDTIHQTLLLFGEPESKVGTMIEALHSQDVEIAYCAHEKGLTLYISGKIHEKVEKMRLYLESLFAQSVVNGNSLAEELIELLQKKELKLAVAESCSGGLIAAELTQYAGVSNCFLGSVVAYDNEIKKHFLFVDESILCDFGAVSEDCCRAMLLGAMNAMGSDCAIAVTGIAGPDGGTSEKPVGTVFIGVCYRNIVEIECCHFYGERKRVQNQTMLKALFNLRNCIKIGDKNE